MGPKDELVEHIEITLVEVRDVAQPNDMAELNSLLLDAKEAETDDTIIGIRRQVDNLRKFCESRRMSSGTLQAVAARRVSV